MLKEIKVKNWVIKIEELRSESQAWASGYVIGLHYADSFIKYNRKDKDSAIAYDFPARVPKYVKEKVRVELNKLAKGW